MAKFSLKSILKVVGTMTGVATGPIGWTSLAVKGSESLSEKRKSVIEANTKLFAPTEIETGFSEPKTPILLPEPAPVEEVFVEKTPLPPVKPIQYTTVTIRSQNYPERNFVTVSVDNDLDPGVTVVVPNTYFPFIATFTNYGEAAGRRYISSWLYSKLLTDYQTDSGRLLSNLDRASGIYPYYNFDWGVFQTAAINQTLSKRPDSETAEIVEDGGVIDGFDTTPQYLLQWLDFPLKDSNNFPTKRFPLLIDYGFRPALGVKTDESLARNNKGELKPVYKVDTILAKTPVMTSVEDGYTSMVEAEEYEGSRKKDIDKLTQPKTTGVDDALANAGNKGLSALLGKGAELAGKAFALQAKIGATAGLAAGALKTVKGFKLPKVEKSKFKVFPKTKKEKKENIKRKSKLKQINSFTPPTSLTGSLSLPTLPSASLPITPSLSLPTSVAVPTSVPNLNVRDITTPDMGSAITLK